MVCVCIKKSWRGQQDRGQGSDLHGEAGYGQQRGRLADDLGAAVHSGLVWQLEREKMMTDLRSVQEGVMKLFHSKSPGEEFYCEAAASHIK